MSETKPFGPLQNDIDETPKKPTAFGALNDDALNEPTAAQVEDAKKKAVSAPKTPAPAGAFGAINESVDQPTDLQVQRALEAHKPSVPEPATLPDGFGALTQEMVGAPTDLQVQKAEAPTPAAQPIEASSATPVPVVETGAVSPSETTPAPVVEALPSVEQQPKEKRTGLESILRSKAVISISEKLSAASTTEILAGTAATTKHSQEKTKGDLVEGYKVTVKTEDGKTVEIYTGGRSQGKEGISQDANALGLGELANGQKFLIMANTDGVTNSAYGHLSARLLGELAVTLGEQEKWDSLQNASEGISSGLTEASIQFRDQMKQFLLDGNELSESELTSVEKGIAAANEKRGSGDQVDAKVMRGIIKDFVKWQNSPLAQKALDALVSYAMVNVTLHNPSTGETFVLKAGDTKSSINGQQEKNSEGVEFGKKAVRLQSKRFEGVTRGAFYSDFVEKDQHASESAQLEQAAAGTISAEAATKQVLEDLAKSDTLADDATFILFQHV